jgi:hypothetical protein
MVVLSLGLLAAGCGGAGSDSLSRADYVSRGDAICKRAEAAKGAAVGKAYAQLAEEGKPFTPAVGKRLIVEAALPPIRQMVKDLNALGTPSENGETAEAMVDEFEKAVSTIASEPNRALTENPLLFKPARQLAREYGFELCSRNLSNGGS